MSSVVVGVALVLSACAKVSITPLGLTSEGRQQFEVTCNKNATEAGSCHEKAIDACGSNYETLAVGSKIPMLSSYNGQVFTSPGDRVLLISHEALRAKENQSGFGVRHFAKVDVI